MHDLYNLKSMLVAELENFGKKGELSKASLDVVDKIAHATKNITKVIESCEQEQYSNSFRNSYADGNSYRDNSYANMAYSRAGSGVREELQRLMGEVTDERTREEIRKIMTRI